MISEDEEYGRHFNSDLSNHSGLPAVLNRFPEPDLNRAVPDDWPEQWRGQVGKSRNIVRLADELFVEQKKWIDKVVL